MTREIVVELKVMTLMMELTAVVFELVKGLAGKTTTVVEDRKGLVYQ